MSIEDITTKGDLAAFIQQQLDAARIAALIRQLQGISTGGVESIDFTANNDSNTVTVTHGLGTVPTRVLVTAADLVGGAAVINVEAVNYTDTTFDLKGRHTDGTAITATISVAWEARA